MDKKEQRKLVKQAMGVQAPHRNIKQEGQLFFGPYVPLCKIHDSLLNGLKTRGTKLTPGDRNRQLAGHLTDQRGYTYEDKEWFIREFKPYVN